ncbi:MAG: FAD-dependent oxidoreductase [Terrimicrobiaceae bacterium]|nr:FAD-dependent oxidoreductase [Terrimicrobiaceae bacterium]
MIDVAVVGGGSAGLAAAIAAARAGAETLLIERTGFLGGMGSLALVHTICGLYRSGTEEPVFANAGFTREFAERLLREGGARGPMRMGGLFVLPHDPSAFAALGAACAREAPRLKVWFDSELCTARIEEGRLAQIEVLRCGTKHEVRAGAFVDATGDAALTALAGAGFAQVDGRHLQRPAYIAGLREGPAQPLDGDEKLRLAHAIAGAVKAGALPPETLGAAFRSAIDPGEVFVTIDLDAGGGGWDPNAPGAIASVELRGQAVVRELVRFLAESATGWRQVTVSRWPLRAGVRESRRVRGVHELLGTEVLSGAQFGDGIAEVSWPMELRERATGPRWRHPHGALPAQIPLRVLRHRDVANLWTAGRCVSCDHEAQASIRVMGTCLATGEAAGAAAALAPPDVADWNQLADRVRNRRTW